MAKNNLAKRQKTDSSAESVFVYTGPGCFVPKDVVRAQFDASVVEVSIHAFFNCTKLREVVLNDGLQKIVRGAFCYCTSLRHITLPSTITEVGRHAFHNCQNLREVVLNEGGLQKIDDDAFSGCTSLERIAIPSTITEIGSEAFCWCENLREVVLNEGLLETCLAHCNFLSVQLVQNHYLLFVG